MTASTPPEASRYAFAIARILLGWIFLWAFLDKTFGLGFATKEERAWTNGGSPTKGFLGSAAKGPFTDFYHKIAGAPLTDWLFMLALLGLGISLILGIGLRVAAAAGGLLVLMMWSVALPPENNPFSDEHLIYLTLLIGLALSNAGDTLGLGRWWAQTPLVRRAPWLR